MIINDLDQIDQGAFVVIKWKDKKIMLPISFNAGEISFTDKKWLWSYKDMENGLHQNSPRLAKLLPNGKIVESSCHLPEETY